MFVAAYCRVSTDREDQTNSFAAQQRFFREYIERRQDWELFDIYADEGITGTSTKKRLQFNRMIREAQEGKFSLILTKEVSRFSRNILDTISYTRQLRAMGVNVLFLTDGIDTRKPDAELYLAIMGTLAQEESRRTSGRVVWGQTRQMERGVVFGQSLLGYDVRKGTMTINPQGADIVRLIFRKYALEQMSIREIAGYLTEKGFRTSRGGTKWSPNAVSRILSNEKYVGDLVQKKTYTPDYLTHEKRRNTGQVPLIRIENHHEPIISREIWDMVRQRKKETEDRMEQGSGSCRCPFSGKIRCGECGSLFLSRRKYRKNGSPIPVWRCGKAVKEGKEGCDVGRLLTNEQVMWMVKTALKQVVPDRERLMWDVTARAAAECPGAGISDDRIHALLVGEGDRGSFYRCLLHSVTVFKDRHLELRLQGLERVFYFEEDAASGGSSASSG